MASVEIPGSGVSARITYDLTQDVAANTSTIQVSKVEVKSNYGYHYTCWVRGDISVAGSRAITMTLTSIAGCAVYTGPDYAGGGPGSWSGCTGFPVTVQHDPDGTATIPISCSINVTRQDGKGSLGSVSGSTTVTLPAIPRVSEFSANEVALGEDMTITLSRASGDFRDTVTFRCGSESGSIAESTGETILHWTPSVDLARQAPDSVILPIELTVTTFRGSTQIGSRSMIVSCTVPESVVPTANLTIEDLLGHVAAYGSFVQSRSQIRVVTSAEGALGSQITAIRVTCGGLTGAGASVSFTPPGNGNMPITATVTDSRGRTATAQTEVPVQSYDTPSVNLLRSFRCDAQGNEQPDGSCLCALFSAQIQPLGGHNSAVYTLLCRELGTDTWTDCEISTFRGSFSVSGGSAIFPAAIDKTYELLLLAGDDFARTESAGAIVPVAFALIDVCRGTRSIGLGQRAGMADTICIGVDTRHYGHRITDVGKAAALTDAATLDAVYPVGAIYLSTNAASPAQLFGGDWARIQDRFLLAAGDSYAPGSMGGEAKHTLTEQELPSISGSFTVRKAAGYNSAQNAQGITTISNDNPNTSYAALGSGAGYADRVSFSFGENAAHENMPPYLAVYVWQRIA